MARVFDEPVLVRAFLEKEDVAALDVIAKKRQMVRSDIIRMFIREGMRRLAQSQKQGAA